MTLIVKKILKYLNFVEENNFFTKKINEESLQVDFAKQQIIYPKDLKVNERQTLNFSSPENFVVFECVHRLLEKGYHPEDLELEPKWKLGHGASGGRADILVRKKSRGEQETGEPLLIIECKTWGEEYDKEKNKMLTNGGQLFSYFQQERSTRYLCLYSSNFANIEEDKLLYENAIVKVVDREQDKKDYEAGDKKIKLYEKAKNNKELFEVWQETFNCYFHYNGIFEQDVNAYEIELKPLKKKDLKPLTEASKIFNSFMEILRHNNISDNANAFNRFLSLLLCKIVDEEKGEEQVLEFQVKEGEDTPERIQDRLQKLYAKGMDEHLGQKIVYFEDEKIDEIVKSYSRVSKTKQIENIFKQIKYYTQNEFALKEVHNKELFTQNAKVLNEFIKMLQNFQFRYTKKQQILGDFFELLLNHGVKQNEGQFFTPVPIVRFMILSLGLDEIVTKKLAKREKKFLPKVLDYACGAGHFLTESIDELQHYIDHLEIDKIIKVLNKNKNLEKNELDNILRNAERYKESTEWAKDYIYGIEKDYRLARTSQIACFLNGDGLENHKKLNCEEEKNLFDVVLSNPPYSIKSFKNYLNIGRDDFTLFENLTENSKEIENLFIERTAQLLKEGGRVGIILPSSLLSNDSDLHFATRKILLEHFHIKGIASFGSGTFGATGTNTVILFLEKRHFYFAHDRKVVAEEIFNNGTKENYLDRDRFLQLFVDYRKINLNDYKSLINKEPNEEIKNSSLYKDYQNWFDSLIEIKNLKTKNSFKNLSQDEKEKELQKRFFQKVLEVEQEKFYLFMLTLKDDYRKKETIEEAYKYQQTVIVQSGEKQTAKSFLGYEFSSRKGSEGIKINRNSKGHAINKMCDEENHHNPQKANSYLLKSFKGEEIKDIDKEIQEHVKVAKLTDMLDFEKVKVNTTISLNPKINNEVVSKWEMVKLGEIVENIESGNRPIGGVGNIKEGILSLGGEHINANNGYIQLDNPKYVSLDFYQNRNKSQLEENDILICKDGALTGKIALLRKELENKKAMINEHVFILRCNNLRTQKYIFNFLFSKQGQSLLKENITGAVQGGLNSTNLKNIKIPLPTLEIQQKIVSECEAIDQEVSQAQAEISTCKNKIENLFKNAFNQKESKQFKLSEKSYFDVFIGKRVLKEEIENNEGKIPVYSANVFEPFGKVKKSFIKDFSNPSILWGIDGDWMVSYISENQEFFPTDHCGVIRVLIDRVEAKFLAWILNKIGIEKNFSRTYRASTDRIKNLSFKFPIIKNQKSLLQKIEELEQQINKNQKVVDSGKSRKEEILERELY